MQKRPAEDELDERSTKKQKIEVGLVEIIKKLILPRA